MDFNFQSIPDKAVLDVLEKINPKKSPGWDPAIPPIFLKKVAPVIASSLRTSFNCCIDESCWSNKWKMGEWTPVFKKGDKHAKENFRPITVLPVVGKAFEHLLCKQITTYCDHTLYSRMTANRKP